MQSGDMLIVFLRSFRKVRFRKMQFLKDGVQTVVRLGANMPSTGDCGIKQPEDHWS